MKSSVTPVTHTKYQGKGNEIRQSRPHVRKKHDMCVHEGEKVKETEDI